MRYILTCILLCSFWELGWGQVARVEYFVDTDPGLGQATAVSFAPGTAISANFTVPLTGVSLGFHTLCVRTRDAQRRWSLTQQQAFFTTVLASANQALTAAEYFIDQEPGLGRGTAIGLPAGQATATVSFNVGLGAVSAGFHTLYLRTRDAQGAWSLTQAQAFYVLSVPSASQALARAEYFIDQDPGLGSGTPITLPAGQPSAAVAFNVSLANVTTGAHTLYVRAADKGKAWSLTQQQAFLVKSGGGLATITAFEYNFTGLGANASYTSATLRYAVPTPAASVSLNFTADLSQLPGDAEYNMHVWAISSEGLRSLVQTKRVRACSNLPVKAGFDLITLGQQVSFVDTSRNAQQYRWNFGDSQTDTVSNPTHTYQNIGQYSVRQIVRNFCNTDTLTKTLIIKGIQKIQPTVGGNHGWLTMLVYGVGFSGSTQLRLQAGSTTIVPDTLAVTSGGVLQALFNLTGKPPGKYDVITDFGTTTAVSPQAFTLLADQVGPQAFIDITGRDAIRINVPQTYEVRIGNTGLSDAFGVPACIVIEGDSNATAKFDSDFPLPDNSGLYPLIRPYIKPDSLYGKPFNGIVIPLYVPNVPVDNSRVVRMTLTTSRSVKIDYWVSPPFYGANSPSLLNGDAVDCLKGIITELMNGFFPASDAANCYNASIGLGLDIAAHFSSINKQEPKSLVWSLIKGGAACAPLLPAAAALRWERIAHRAIITAINIGKVGNKFEDGILKDASKCAFVLDSYLKRRKNITAVTSFDPNEKLGPSGSTARNFVAGKTPADYIIYFENLRTATAAAQTVVIIDSLDKQVLDLKTFQLSALSFGGDHYVKVPPGLSAYATTVDLRPAQNLLVRTDARLDTAAGVLVWRFLSLNPATMELTDDPRAGFLPPNLVSPAGEGFVSFSVQAKKSLTTGVQIRNKSTIYFDNNAPIVTNTFLNTIDKISPISAISSVLPTATNNIFLVNWNGSDQHSGIRNYDIVYTINGRSPRTWLAGTSATTALFTGRRDSTYCFYSIARDSAGNVEAAPLVPDVCKTLVVLSQHPSSTATPEGFTVYPNPTSGVFTVEAYALKPEQSGIQIENVVGQIVYSEQLRLNAGTLRREIDASRFAPGIYIVKMSIDGRRVVRKVVKN